MQCACKRTPFQGSCKTPFRLLKPAESSYGVTRCRTPRRFDAQQLHLSARKSPGQLGCQSSTVSSGSTSQTSSADPDQPTTTTASTSDTLTTSEAVYVKGPVAPGTVLDYPDKSVVILGDIPVTSRVRAGGDVIVMGTLSGDVESGCEGDESSLILISKISPSASLSIAGRITAAAAAPVGRDTNLMLLLQPGETAPAFQAMPGTPLLKAAATEVSVLPKLARAAGALAVLSLGLALVVAPGAVLGNLLSVGAESVAGALLDVSVFGYILLKGAGLLSEGSELLLEVLNPGIIGGVVLPVLGALPDSLIILTSLSAAQAEAQEQVAVGIGTLAGSTVLLLSLAWGVSVLLGRCDLSPLGVAVDKKHTRGWDLVNTGVTVDRDVRQGAQIMGVSVLLYGIVQVPAFLGFSKSPQAALTGAAVCLVGMVAYCCYSVMYPQLQQRRIDAARKKRFRMVAVKSLALQSSERYQSSLVDPYGRPVPSMVRQIFDDFDVDRNGYIDADELPALLTTLKYASGGGTVDDEGVKYLLKEFDTNSDAQISYDEFQTALSRWVGEKLSSTAAAGGGGMQGFQRRYEQLMDPRSGGAAAAVLADLPEEDLEQLQETAVGLDQESPEEAAEDLDEQQQPLTTADIWRKSVLCMAAGVALCAVFSDPLVEALTNLSRATGIPPFVVGFVLTPLASNSSEFVSSLTFAARKRRKNMSLTLSQVYGAVTLNNTLVLGLFLLVVYLRRLEWVYSSEVTVIVASTLAVAFLGYSRSTFRAIWAVPVIALYPLSLLGVYALDTFLGWQ